MTQLWLARHGETDWNIAGRYQGQADIPLNENGRVQAELLAERLSSQVFDALFSSDLLRARQTAQYISNRLGLPVQLEPRFREIHQGDWQGLCYADIVEQYGQGAKWSSADPAEWRAPGGESVLEVAARVTKAADDITARYPNGSVLVVAHGLCLASLLCQATGIPLKEVYGNIPENTGLIKIEWPSSFS